MECYPDLMVILLGLGNMNFFCLTVNTVKQSLSSDALKAEIMKTFWLYIN
jgi:hypothetical protein